MTDKQITKQWANPTPAGLVALAVACFCFFALLTGRVGKNALPLMGCFLIGGFFIQIVVAIIDLKGGNLSGGNTFLYFSVYFMLVSGSEMFFKYYMPGVDTRIDGYAWLALAIAVLLFTPAFFKSPAILFVIVLFLNVALPMIVIIDLQLVSSSTATALSNIAAYSLLICGVLGLYLGAAIMTNTTYGKNIFPNPKPFYKENN